MNSIYFQKSTHVLVSRFHSLFPSFSFSLIYPHGENWQEVQGEHEYTDISEINSTGEKFNLYVGRMHLIIS
jgi:hypothetical protein